MAVLDRIPPERRRKTGVLIPVVVLATLSTFAPGPAIAVDRHDQLWSGGLMVVGLVTGAVWQWYSPRSVGDRLLGPALAVTAVPFVMLLVPGKMSFYPWILETVVALAAGLVLADVWIRSRAKRAGRSGSGGGRVVVGEGETGG